jgi:DNA-binding CsgD family transcriptional regulator
VPAPRAPEADGRGPGNGTGPAGRAVPADGRGPADGTVPAAGPGPANGPGPAGGSETPGGTLTNREREVVALIVLGKSNKAIAEDLFISPATAARHVANILAKLGYSSRSQVAAWAAAEGARQA